MTLTDTGPLYALVDTGQTDAHQRCTAALSTLRKPLLTTWPCFVEAMYLCGERGGWRMQKLLWQYVEKGVVHFYSLTENDIARMRELMEKYQDTPMDLADASLVAAAETLSLKRVFTLDSDFYVYRLQNRATFEIVP